MTLKNKLTLTTCALALASVGIFSNASAIEYDGTGLDEDGTFHVFMAPPTNETEKYALNEMISDLAPGYGITSGGEWQCNDALTSCKLVRGGEGWTDESYGITYEYDEKADAMVDALIEGIRFSEDGYLVHDMEILQYWAYGAETLPAFSSEIKSLVDHKNIDLFIDVRMGGDSPLINMQGGMGKVYYDGVLYHIHDEPVMVYAPHIFYVEDDAEDLAAALEQRIADIFGEEALTLISVEESEDKVSDLIEGEWDEANRYFADYLDENVHYLCLSDGETGVCIPILILKDSSKIFTPEGVNSTDLLTDINITSSAANLPADAATYAYIIGDELDEEAAAEVEEQLGTDLFHAIEIGLYSASLDTEINDNDGREFTVSVPVPESLKDVEKISAYWINHETEEPEEHYAKVSNGVAVFDTDHFSTYILAESSADRPEDEPEEEPEDESDEDTPGVPNSGSNTGMPNGTATYLSVIVALTVSAIATGLIFRKDEK